MLEPIDVLLHALHLCEDKYIRMDFQSKFGDQLDEDIKKHSDTIRHYFEQLKQNFLQADPQFLLETYQSQVKLMMVNKKSRAAGGEMPPPGIAAGTQNRQTQKQTQSVGGNILNIAAASAPFDLATFAPFYQCLLGSIESLLEHNFMNGQFKYLKNLNIFF
jgi:hypothetical protein